MEPQFAPPPRTIPWTLRLSMMCGQPLWFIGVLVFFSGTVTMTSYLPLMEPMFSDPFADARRVGGKITKVDKLKVCFQWPGSDGATHSSHSYAYFDVPTVGSDAVIEVTDDTPPLARVHGLRAFPYSKELGYPLLLMLIAGASMIALGAWRGHRLVRFLKHGMPSRGRRIERRETKTTIWRTDAEDLTFAFVDTAGRERTVRTRRLRFAKVLDDAEEPVLYMPDSDHALLLRDSWLQPRWNESGELEPARTKELWLPLVPVLVGAFYQVCQLAQ